MFSVYKYQPAEVILEACYINGWDLTFFSNQSTDEGSKSCVLNVSFIPACLSNVRVKRLHDNFYFFCGFSYPSVLMWKSFITSEISFEMRHVNANFIVSIFSLRNLQYVCLCCWRKRYQMANVLTPTQFSPFSSYSAYQEAHWKESVVYFIM